MKEAEEFGFARRIDIVVRDMTMNVLTDRGETPYPCLCRGEGYYLKRLLPEDVTETYVRWLQDEEVVHYLQVRFEAHDLESTRRYVAGFDHRDNFIFAIHDARTDRYIGNVTLRVNPIHLWANFGYMIGDKSYWSTGAALGAVRLLLDFAFFERQIRKILEITTENHIASNFNFRRLGFTLAAKIPDLYWGEGRYRAGVWWTMDAATWAEMRGREVPQHAVPNRP